MITLPFFCGNQLDKNFNALNAALGGGGVVQQTAKIHIDSAHIKNLVAAPVELVAAPGANKAVFVVSMYMRYNFVSVDYSDGGGLAKLVLALGALAPVGSITDYGAVIASFGESVDVIPNQANNWFFPQSGGRPVNQPLLLANTGAADFSLGDGSLDVLVAYWIVDLT